MIIESVKENNKYCLSKNFYENIKSKKITSIEMFIKNIIVELGDRDDNEKWITVETSGSADEQFKLTFETKEKDGELVIWISADKPLTPMDIHKVKLLFPARCVSDFTIKADSSYLTTKFTENFIAVRMHVSTVSSNVLMEDTVPAKDLNIMVSNANIYVVGKIAIDDSRITLSSDIGEIEVDVNDVLSVKEVNNMRMVNTDGKEARILAHTGGECRFVFNTKKDMDKYFKGPVFEPAKMKEINHPRDGGFYCES